MEEIYQKLLKIRAEYMVECGKRKDCIGCKLSKAITTTENNCEFRICDALDSITERRD